MKNKNIMAGLEFEFGDTIKKKLFHIFNLVISHCPSLGFPELTFYVFILVPNDTIVIPGTPG